MNGITVKGAEGNKYNIAMITDDGYVMPTMVALTSLDENVCNNVYDVHLLTNDISEESIRLFEKQKFKNVKVNLIDVTEIVKNFKDIIQHRHVTYTALLKFYLPQVFPQFEKILYIDGDILVQKDLLELFYIDITNYYAAVVKDTSDVVHHNHKKKIGMSDGTFFNSGVMLLNLKKMRENNVTEKLMEYKLHHWHFFMDQDAFNVIFENQVKYISYKYNFLNCYLNAMNKEQLSELFNENISAFQTDEKLYRSCTILHLGGKEKPWIYDMGYLSRLYEKYYEKTIFAKNKLSLKPLNTNNKPTNYSPLLFKDIGLGCNTWCEPRNVSGNAYTYDLSDNIYTRYVSWDPIKEGSCDVEIVRLSAVERRSGRVVEFPVDRIISSGKISGRRVEFRNQKCWIGCAVEGAYESFTVEAKIRNV